MADTDIPFPLTLGKAQTQTLEGLVIWNFSIQLIFMKWRPFFNFFLMADTDIPFLLTLRKLAEMQIICWFRFPSFLLVQLSMSPILGLVSRFKTFILYAWWPFCTLSKKVPRKIRQNRLTHLCVTKNLPSSISWGWACDADFTIDLCCTRLVCIL